MPFIEHDPTDMNSFKECLVKSKRILALCGAGLSASSGLATFRGAGGMWKTHDAMSLATPGAFERDPSLVWHFYSARRHAAFRASPNAAHYALAAASLKNPAFITVTQNVDGLSPRAGHPEDQLFPVHGSLSTLKCTSFYCNYVEHNNYEMALTPELAPEAPQPVGASTTDADSQPPNLSIRQLPHCPGCKIGLLRPGVVWFGESLPNEILDGIDDWFDEGPVDLCLVIGTSGQVWPAAGYSYKCKMKGAKVAVINMEISTDPELGATDDADWLFEGDCAQILPEILKPIIGDMDGIYQQLAGHNFFPPSSYEGGPVTGSPERTGEGTGYY